MIITLNGHLGMERKVRWILHLEKKRDQVEGLEYLSNVVQNPMYAQSISPNLKPNAECALAAC